MNYPPSNNWMLENRHDFGCIDCEKETRTMKELKLKAINHFKNSKKCHVCLQRDPSFLKITYNSVPYADQIDKNYMIFHILVLAAKNNWQNATIVPYCYHCYDKEKDNFKSFPDKGVYNEFISEF